ncbi:hypothetical protein [Nocardioides sp.]|uniref:hypothetical protein n=1 Tax=Nocardioides sp. TaxID=35761 RepID=UPI0035686BFE
MSHLFGSSTEHPDQPEHPDHPHDLDPSFVFDFTVYDDRDDTSQRWSTWLSVEPLSRGPEPRPDWVVTSQGAIDTELSVLKTGKEADVFLVERGDPRDPDAAVVMAAKRYRSTEHRTFHRAATYTEGRSTKRSRDARAWPRPVRSPRCSAPGSTSSARRWCCWSAPGSPTGTSRRTTSSRRANGW